MFLAMGITIDQISWTQIATPDAPWYRPHQSATIAINGHVLGTIGKGNPLVLTKLGIQEEIDAAFVELDLEAILAMEVTAKKFVSLPKFQETYLDFSFMVPLVLQANKLQAILQEVSPLVQRVELIDFFEKESWDNQRSLTFRVWLLDHEGTIDKTTLDGVWQVASTRTQALGAVLRTL
jgi:phenylalanyl-tRNA synthetase beta subunit